MKAKTKNKLFEAWAYADMEDKSTEWMIAYMQDFAQVDHDTVTDFIFNEGKNRSQWYKENPNWFMKYESISENQLRALEIIHNHKTSISGL